MNKLLNDLVNNNIKYTSLGKTASYIPALKDSNPNQLGIAVRTKNGEIFTAGNAKTKFTMQSVSKVASLMLALKDNGFNKVFCNIGMEPTGEAFNSIIKLETVMPSRPFNPFVNAGAIAIASLIKGETTEEKMNRLLGFIKEITGNNELNINEEVYKSEKATGHKNRALAYFMKDIGIIDEKVEDLLDVYFMQCSIEVNCIDLANIGLYLALDGYNINNNRRDIDEKITKAVKALMTTCGMYNSSGEFAVKVGIPAKSGVGGGIVASVPKTMGIGTFGPSLDEKGNSIAGINLIKDFVEKNNFNIY